MPKKCKSILDIAVMALYEPIAEYSAWYDEQGLYLPPDYSNRPSDWCEALHKIERSFKLLHDEINLEGELLEARKNTPDLAYKLEREIEDGLKLFGEQMLFMTDTIVDRGSSH